MKNKIAVILYQHLSEHPTLDDEDVLEQVAMVKNALIELKYDCVVRDIGNDLYGDLNKIRELHPCFVFNLVEVVFGKTELLPFIASMMKVMHIPYTGVSDSTLFLTTSKPLAKKYMKQAGIRTAEWFPVSSDFKPETLKKYILKPEAEEGSISLDEDAVFSGQDFSRILNTVKGKSESFFIEEFIEGREFNLSVIGTPGHYEVFPVAEMCYNDFPEGKEHLLGYRAKWEENSFEYQHTSRSFDTLKKETELKMELIDMALKCGDVFDISGYYRVDFRVSKDNKPFVLEINGNPCLSPFSGFMSAAAQKGINNTEIIKRIVDILN
ncbi:MAG: ATP-grasp domain-containing protein [Prolixibacteraceae bacterium]|nr:ATP-grasp domain-containing protein [Prolixibacteraceae bacterium]